MPTSYVIIGNGPAGLAAAEAVREIDLNGHITIVSDEPHDFYSRPGLAYLLNGTIPEKMLFSRGDDPYQSLEIEHVIDKAVRLEPDRARVDLESGRTLTFDRLLLATGSRAVLPEIPGVRLRGVVTLDTLDDARAILRMAKRARSAVVIGGGITALELAEGLAARRVRTHYLLRKEHYWSNVLTEDESILVEARLTEMGIQLHRQTELEQVLGKRGRVVGVLTKAGERIRCQIVAIAIGVRPQIELAQSGGIEVDLGILTDEKMVTSVPNIYAAGDAAQAFDATTGTHKIDSLWWMAIQQGRTAGANMAGRDQRLSRDITFNVTRIGGLTTTVIGAVGTGSADEDLVAIVHGDSESWREKPEAFALADHSGENRLRIVLGSTTIEGALVMGDQSCSQVLQDMIRNRVDVTPIRAQLLQAQAPIERILQSFWEDSRAHHETQS